MEPVVGLLKIRVLRGHGLIACDADGGDPYVVVTMADQKVKTSGKKGTLNPEWNEDLTLSISEPIYPINIEVFDKDTFTQDDKMGNAEFSILPLVACVKMDHAGTLDGTVISCVLPHQHNCLAGESPIKWKDGRLVQDIRLRLRNVDSGEVELQLQWVSIPSVSGL